MCPHNLVLCLLTVVGVVVVCRVLLVVGDDNSVLVGKIGISSVVGVAAASVGRFGLAMLANQIYHWVWVGKSRKKPNALNIVGQFMAWVIIPGHQVTIVDRGIVWRP